MEEIEEPIHPESTRIDYEAVRSGFVKSIVVAYAVGLLMIIAFSTVLVAIDKLNWWRFWFNLAGYNLVALPLAYIIYRQAVRTWLKGHASGRVLSAAEIGADAVYSAGGDTLISSWSKGAERMLGYTAEEMIGHSVAEILPEDFVKREIPMLATLFTEGIVIGHQSFNVRKNGDVFPTEASITLLREPDGSPAGFLTVLRDRTHQAQIEEELRRVRDDMKLLELEAADRPGGGNGEDERFDEIRKTAEATVSALAAVAERRDPYTAGHQKRVSELATAIGREMGLPEDQVEGIRVAGILHDTGKVVIPGEILSKPADLSEFEFGMIKSHPKVDSEIVEGIDFPWPVARTVLQHHERLDGSGYPFGLQGDDIIMEARILAVADVVEAMSSHRPYRPALGIQRALEEVDAGRGTQFDPAVVDTCLKLFRELDYELR